jgi:hypothetical protein
MAQLVPVKHCADKCKVLGSIPAKRKRFFLPSVVRSSLLSGSIPGPVEIPLNYLDTSYQAVSHTIHPLLPRWVHKTPTLLQKSIADRSDNFEAKTNRNIRIDRTSRCSFKTFERTIELFWFFEEIQTQSKK